MDLASTEAAPIHEPAAGVIRRQEEQRTTAALSRLNSVALRQALGARRKAFDGQRS